MAATQEETNRKDENATARSEIKPNDNPNPKIDREAPAGSEKSLGAESVRDGRPATDDDVVEAIDEATPGAPD